MSSAIVAKGDRIAFTRGDKVVANVHKLGGSDLAYIYTEKRATVVPNYCDKCKSAYYYVTRVNDVSLLSTAVNISRCPHSLGVEAFVRVAKLR